jgi:hypothetical protein
MSHDSHTPITSSWQLDWPTGHRMWTTTRVVPAEYGTPGNSLMPVVGQTMAKQLGASSPYANNVIVRVQEGPTQDGKIRLTLEHTTIPTGVHTRYQSMAFVFPPIYPNNTTFFPGGSAARPRTVIAKTDYQFALSAAAWMEEASIWDFTNPASGPFEVESFLAESANVVYEAADGQPGTIGDFLFGTFVAQDTIHNAIEISVPGDLYYVIPPSRPSATQYAQWVASKTLLMASRTVDDWYGNILVKRTAWVRAQ